MNLVRASRSDRERGCSKRWSRIRGGDRCFVVNPPIKVVEGDQFKFSGGVDREFGAEGVEVGNETSVDAGVSVGREVAVDTKEEFGDIVLDVVFLGVFVVLVPAGEEKALLVVRKRGGQVPAMGVDNVKSDIKEDFKSVRVRAKEELRFDDLGEVGMDVREFG